MPIESQVQVISELNPKYPATDDPVSQGDNHLRNIKTALVNTFPNIDAPVDATEDEINQLVGKDFANDISDLDSKLSAEIDALDVRVTKNEADIADGQQVSAGIRDDLNQLENEFDNHTINSHDVDTSRLEPGAILLWNGSNWVAKKLPLGGGMIKMAVQPRTAGDCNYMAQEQKYMGSISSGGTCTLTVPAGLVFCLEYFYGKSGSTQSNMTIEDNNIVIDGVNVSPETYYSTNLEYTHTGGPPWPGNEGFQTLRVEKSVRVKSVSGSGTIHFCGIFIEAEV